MMSLGRVSVFIREVKLYPTIKFLHSSGKRVKLSRLLASIGVQVVASECKPAPLLMTSINFR